MAIEVNDKNAQYFSNAADAMWGLGKLQEAVNLDEDCKQQVTGCSDPCAQCPAKQ